MISFILFHSVHLLLTVFLVQTLTMIWRAGMFDLGHFAYLAIGAYIAATLSLMLPSSDWFLQSFSTRLIGFCALLGMSLIAGAAASAIAYIFGKFLTKFSGDYFAVATLVFSEAIIRSISVFKLTEGDRGFDIQYIFASRSTTEALYFNGIYFTIALILNVVVFMLFRRLYHSHRGLILDATRIDSLSVDARGTDSATVKLKVYILCSGMAAAIGVVYLNFSTLITPNDFSFLNSLPVVICVILGNHKPYRAIVFTVLLYVIYECAKLRFFGVFGNSFGNLAASWKEAIYGITLLVSIVGTHYYTSTRASRLG